MSRWSIFVKVPGRPRPQGSTTRMATPGTGRIYGKKNPGEQAHRDRVTVEARKARRGVLRTPAGGAVQVAATFEFARPASHHIAGDRSRPLKPDAPGLHTITPDADKLARLICDALTGVVYVDDSQVAVLAASKYWSDRDYTSITVTGMRDDT